MSRDQADMLTDRFATELGKLATFRLMSRDRIHEILKAQQFSRSDSCSASDCAIEAGRMLAIQYIIYGSVGHLGDTYTVNASLANVETGETERPVSHDVTGKIDEVLTHGMAAVARQLAGMPADLPTSPPTPPIPRPPDNRTVRILPPADGPRACRTVELGNGIAIDMVWIPPGTFEMGNPADEPARFGDEVPVHRVTLSTGFWMAKCEVTQEQWQRVMGNNPSRFRNVASNLPVEQVSWEDCQTFCEKLTATAGKGNGLFRLPTEAEWEYACRGGADNLLQTGNNTGDVSKIGWFDSTAPHAVGRKQPNAWGLFDMHGNVWEWCQDWKGPYTQDATTDPAGPASGASRILRGGSWYELPQACRVSARGHGTPTFRSCYIGLRVVLAAPGPN